MRFTAGGSTRDWLYDFNERSNCDRIDETGFIEAIGPGTKVEKGAEIDKLLDGLALYEFNSIARGEENRGISICRLCSCDKGKIGPEGALGGYCCWGTSNSCAQITLAKTKNIRDYSKAIAPYPNYLSGRSRKILP